MMRWRPRLATVLFAVNLLIFLLPLGGIAVLRLYDSELVRHTESELNVQGAFVASIFRGDLLSMLTPDKLKGMRLSSRTTYGVPVAPEFRMENNPDAPWTPVEATLDLARDRIHMPAHSALETDILPDPVAKLAGERVTPVLLSAGRMTLSAIRVTDYRGVVVASTGHDFGESLATQDEVKRALRGERVSLLRQRISKGPSPPLDSISRGSKVRVFVGMPVILGDRVLGAVLLSRTPLDLSKALYRNRSYLLGACVVTVLVVCIVTVLSTRLVTRPVKALIHQAKQVTEGKKAAASLPLRNPGTYEVDSLSRAVAQMSVTLEKRADYIRAFASNISHEFKTPLTSMRGTVELLKDHLDEMQAEDRDRFLHILEQDADRLTKLVQRLLDLARADVLTPGAECTDVAEALNRVTDRFRRKGLAVTIETSREIQEIAMAPDVFESVISNLLDNAAQHGGTGVNAHIFISSGKDAGRNCVEIVVQDDGKGIAKHDAEKVFAPFFTTARQSGGTGLGLSIVRTLISAHHGSITLEPSLSGARFRLVLPVAQESKV
jgi:signal transduction histidine kinase